MKFLFFVTLFISNNLININAYRIINITANATAEDVFKPFEATFIGMYGDPSNLQRERVNEGAYETPSQELIYEGNNPRQDCPSMIGPFSDGSYYCTSQVNGYCDRRSGTCFCNTGYQGLDCTECQPSYYLMGSTCYPKILCPQNCNNAGDCNYNTGICTCQPHRTGPSCNIPVCSVYSPFCESCSTTSCTHCRDGYYLTSDRKCQSCHDFDPRCSSCSAEEGCLQCIDPILTSIRRSGARLYDTLPFEEDTREFSINLPFGTQDPAYFTEAETYTLCGDASDPLKNHTVSCDQGVDGTATWVCKPYPSSYIVCGHAGVFKLQYNNYTVYESDRYMRLYVQRSGGGCGTVSLGYYIRHVTSSSEDVTATAPYTSSQTLVFGPGMFTLSYAVQI